MTNDVRQSRFRPLTAWALCLTAMLCASSAASVGELAVIVNPRSGIGQLSKAEVIHLLMGRQKKLPSGATALTVDQGGQEATKANFYAKLVGKDLSEINSYWARIIFSGQGSPPMQAGDTDEVLEIVGDNNGAIGYVDRGKVDSRVKVVFTLPY